MDKITLYYRTRFVNLFCFLCVIMQGARAQPNSIEQPTVTNLMRGTLFGSEPIPLQRCILWGKT